MPYSMLIVTGCAEWGDSLIRYFEKREFNVTGCPKYREAARIVASRRFDIAIIDFFIGKTAGGALCDKITLQQAGDTSLIIVSGKQSAAIERAVRRRSPAYYFVKPCSFENLHAVALRICGERDNKELQKKAQRGATLKGMGRVSKITPGRRAPGNAGMGRKKRCAGQVDKSVMEIKRD